MPPEGVFIPPEIEEYFDELSQNEWFRAQGVELTGGQKAWYAKKYETQQDDMKREFPSTPEEAFEEALIGAYYSKQLAKAEKEGRIGELPISEAQVHTAWDLGVGSHDTTAIWFFQVNGPWIDIIDYFEDNEGDLAYIASEIESRGYRIGGHYPPHDIKKRDRITGKNDLERALGFPGVRISPRISVRSGRSSICSGSTRGDAIRASRRFAIIARNGIQRTAVSRGGRCITGRLTARMRCGPWPMPLTS